MADMSNVKCFPKALGYLFFSPVSAFSSPLTRPAPSLEPTNYSWKNGNYFGGSFWFPEAEGLDLLIYHDSFCGVHNTSCLYPGLNEKLRLIGQVLSVILMLYSCTHLM